MGKYSGHGSQQKIMENVLTKRDFEGREQYTGHNQKISQCCQLLYTGIGHYVPDIEIISYAQKNKKNLDLS